MRKTAKLQNSELKLRFKFQNYPKGFPNEERTFQFALSHLKNLTTAEFMS